MNESTGRDNTGSSTTGMTVTFPETTGVAAILANDLEMTGKLPSPVPNVYTYAPFKEASSFGKAA